MASQEVNDPFIHILEAGKRFQDGRRQIVAFDGVSLDIARNEFVTVVGASGCGKSTLLRTISGLDNLTSGKIVVEGREVSEPGVDRAMVFQHYSLFTWLTVAENISFFHNLKAFSDRAPSSGAVMSSMGRAEALQQLVGLEPYKHLYPNQLSGGMQQRTAIARALLARPSILLMDEPFGALDAQTREIMHELVLRLFDVEKTTIIFVTHDVEEAIYLGQRVVLMAPNPGRIDEIFDVPFGRDRGLDLKSDPDFLDLKRRIMARIRETSTMRADLELLDKFSRREASEPDGERADV
ncbi:MAG: ABC transporter ATP-binding protein [Parvibaculum sp.]